MNHIVTIGLLFLVSGFNTSSQNQDHTTHDVPYIKIGISCINAAYVKGQLIISDNLEYDTFLEKSSAAEIMGGDCIGYAAPRIDFTEHYLFVTHVTSGGCEDPDVSRSFYYDTTDQKYKYQLTLIEKGVCRMMNHYFETILVKKSDIDLSAYDFIVKKTH